MTVGELQEKLSKLPPNYIIDIVEIDTGYSYDIHCALLNYHGTVSLVKGKERCIVDLVKEKL